VKRSFTGLDKNQRPELGEDYQSVEEGVRGKGNVNINETLKKAVGSDRDCGLDSMLGKEQF